MEKQFKLSKQQNEALESTKSWVEDWYDGNTDKQVFRLFGYAGTGKTTIMKEVSSFMDDFTEDSAELSNKSELSVYEGDEDEVSNTLFAAFTGKAAAVLRSKGCKGASTIHSLIYKGYEVWMDNDEKIYPLGQFTPEEAEEKHLRKDLRFGLNEDSKVLQTKLLIIDEVSMVGETIGEDLMSFKVPILVVGDPAQLPPVRGSGFFINTKYDSEFGTQPDYLLTEIHRQAAQNPILEYATNARNGSNKLPGVVGEEELKVLQRGKFDKNILVKEVDQVLVGTHKSRVSMNNIVRKAMQDLGVIKKGKLPVKGDKLVALSNDRSRGIMNGTLWIVTEDCKPWNDAEEDGEAEKGLKGKVKSKAKILKDSYIELKIHPENYNKRIVTVKVHTDFFMKTIKLMKASYDEMSKYTGTKMTWGYAVTVHKAQGSQWRNVALVDESFIFRNDKYKWLYTGITRAADKLIVIV